MKSARRSGGSDVTPSTSVRRSWLVKRVTGPPGSGSRADATTSALPMCRRARNSRLDSLTGRLRPSTTTRSPASIGASTAAASADAVADTRRPSVSRSSVRSDPNRHSGSRTSVARTAATSPTVGAPCTPSHARAPSADASTAAARHTPTGCAALDASTATTTATTSGHGIGRAAHAPASVATASATTHRSLTAPAPSVAARPAERRRCPAPRGARRRIGSGRAPSGRPGSPTPSPAQHPAGPPAVRRWPC